LNEDEKMPLEKQLSLVEFFKVLVESRNKIEYELYKKIIMIY